MSFDIHYCPGCTHSGYPHNTACSKSLSKVYKHVQMVDPQFPDRIAYTTVEVPANQCVMCEVFQQQIIRERDMRQNLYELLEYEKMKADAYRMVWSAREYIRATYWDSTNWSGTNHILANALNTLDAERVDGVAIREKYNPKVIKLKKRTEYGYGGSPDCGVVFDRDDWHKHWGPKC